jgi:hypothetical protein
MTKLVAIIDSDTATYKQLADLVKDALKPGGHVYGPDGAAVAISNLTIHRPDSEHLRNTVTGWFESPEQAAADPDHTTHEQGD